MVYTQNTETMFGPAVVESDIWTIVNPTPGLTQGDISCFSENVEAGKIRRAMLLEIDQTADLDRDGRMIELKERLDLSLSAVGGPCEVVFSVTDHVQDNLVHWFAGTLGSSAEDMRTAFNGLGVGPWEEFEIGSANRPALWMVDLTEPSQSVQKLYLTDYFTVESGAILLTNDEFTDSNPPAIDFCSPEPLSVNWAAKMMTITIG